jgi:hypothetical protein
LGRTAPARLLAAGGRSDALLASSLISEDRVHDSSSADARLRDSKHLSGSRVALAAHK